MAHAQTQARLDADLAFNTIFVVRGRPGQNDRPALPAGHPVSWGAITEGTVLEAAEYPFPVFLN